MTLDTLIMLMGGLVLVTPYMGVPVSWFGTIFFVFGVIIIGLGIVARRGGARVFKKTPTKHDFVESSPTVADSSDSEEV